MLQGTSGAAPTGGLPNGQLLGVGGAPTDDRLFISTNLMAVVSGQARATQLAAFNYAAGMAAGDQYAIIWFDATSLGSASAGGLKYGMWADSTGGAANNSTILPLDPGSYTTTATGPVGMFGADNSGTGQSLKVASLSLVPEPSVALLGLAGGLVFLRRRR